MIDVALNDFIIFVDCLKMNTLNSNMSLFIVSLVEKLLTNDAFVRNRAIVSITPIQLLKPIFI